MHTYSLYGSKKIFGSDIFIMYDIIMYYTFNTKTVNCYYMLYLRVYYAVPIGTIKICQHRYLIKHSYIKDVRYCVFFSSKIMVLTVSE